MMRRILAAVQVRARRSPLLCRAALVPLLVGLAASPAAGQSFGLDDNPQAPLTGFLGFGAGAEDPYGITGIAWAPSPSLGLLPALDADILSPGPFIQIPTPNGVYMDSLSRHHVDLGLPVALDFSVDRATVGAAGTAVGSEAAFGQAHGDIYTSTQTYLAPGLFVGLPPGPFAGVLPSIAGGAPGNVLTTDESVFGLLTAAGVVGPGVAVPPPPAAPGQHDNLESYDSIVTFDANGDFLFDVDAYFTIYPDEAFPLALSPADIFAVAAGDPGAAPAPYAPAPFMGLDIVGGPGSDSIDALVMYDNNLKPIPIGPNSPAPGFIEPAIDYALFSLAPGSFSLQAFGLDAGDVLFTDFTGAFAVYAPSASLGLIPTPPGLPFAGDSVDALEVVEREGIDTFTIADGRCVYVISGLVGQRLTAGGGTAQWFTGNLNHMAQNWFWYRSLGDTREYALSNQISAFIGANNVRLMYVEPIFDGQLPGALLFDLEYTLSDLSQIADPPACARCELVIALKVRNFTDEPLLPVDFFSYNDMDLNNSAGGDTAFIAGVDNQIQVIRERLGPSGCTVGGLFKCSSTSHVAWEIGPFAALRTRLTDPFVDVLLNGVSPFGPGDYTGGQQWSFALNPPGPVSPTSEPDEWVGSVVKEVVAYVPGDIDGDCDVDLDDLTLLLQNFGVICVP